MSEENNGAKPQGKGLAVTGFILALTGLVLNAPIMGAALLSGSMGLGYFWVALCVVGTILSAMGMMKLGKSGGKKGLAIAGLIIGIIAVIWSVVSAMAIGVAVDEVGAGMDELTRALDDLENMN